MVDADTRLVELMRTVERVIESFGNIVLWGIVISFFRLLYLCERIYLGIYSIPHLMRCEDVDQ